MGFFRNDGVFLWTCILAAQGFRATILGRVTDESGAVVPATKITITNRGTNESRVVIVGADGEYVIPQVAPGGHALILPSRSALSRSRWRLAPPHRWLRAKTPRWATWSIRKRSWNSR